MFRKVLCLVGLMSFTVTVANSADDPPGVVYVALASLKPPAGKLDAEHKIVQRLGTFGKNPTIVVRREGNSPAEFHEGHSHILIVQSGEGTVVLGGEIVDAKITAPGEIRGTSIRKGIERKLTTGDVLYIPIKTAHQYFVQPGKQLTHLIVNQSVPES